MPAGPAPMTATRRARGASDTGFPFGAVRGLGGGWGFVSALVYRVWSGGRRFRSGFFVLLRAVRTLRVYWGLADWAGAFRL